MFKQNGEPAYNYDLCEGTRAIAAVLGRRRALEIAGALMKRVLEVAREEGYPAVSLSVEKDSNAVALYERFGFQSKGQSEQRPTSTTMVLQLDAAS